MAHVPPDGSEITIRRRWQLRRVGERDAQEQALPVAEHVTELGRAIGGAGLVELGQPTGEDVPPEGDLAVDAGAQDPVAGQAGDRSHQGGGLQAGHLKERLDEFLPGRQGLGVVRPEGGVPTRVRGRENGAGHVEQVQWLPGGESFCHLVEQVGSPPASAGPTAAVARAGSVLPSA